MQLESIVGDIAHLTNQWYVAHCKSHKEQQAAVLLKQRFGLPVYLPQVSQSVRGELRSVPFFPGYLFVSANLYLVSVSKINALPGVLRLISFDDLPQPVPAAVIEELRSRLADLNA